MNGGWGTWLTIGGIVAAVLLGIGWYLSYTAVRLDRLHHRLKATQAALDAQLVRRGEAAVELALGGDLDPATATLLLSAAGAALDADVENEQWNTARDQAESELTEVLRAVEQVILHPEDPDPEASEEHEPRSELQEWEVRQLLERLQKTGVRVQYARRFHNEAVRETASLHAEPIVRTFRLAGHAPIPVEVDFDDAWPGESS